MVTSEARVPTDQASRFLNQLCKHFEHRLKVTYSAEKGSIEYEGNTCHLDAEPQTLVLRAAAPDEETLGKLEHVVASHLERFMFREKPEIRWTRS